MTMPRSRAVDLVGCSLWWGLVAGFLELSVRSASWAIRPRVTVASIRTNRHYLWMTPASDLLLLALAGLALVALARLAPRLVAASAPFALAILAFLGATMAVDQLDARAQVVLACGLGAAAARLTTAHPDRFRGVVRRSLVPGLAVLAGWAAFHEVRAAGAGRSPAVAPSSAKAPNVLLIVLDNVRADNMSLYGYARDTTPNMKRLAERGVRFDQARSTASWTLPSHASMMTGRWPHELTANADTPLDDARPTLAEALARRGYDTAGFVANTYYCNAWYGLDRGFAVYEDFAANQEVSLVEIARSGGVGRWVVDKLKIGVREFPGDARTRKTASRINGDFLSWIDGRGDRPFFAFLNYYDAHAPFTPPEGEPRRFGLSARSEEERSKILRAYARLAKGKGVTNPTDDAATVARAAELLRDSYDDCLAALDRKIGELFADLERRGVLDETLVIVTSDHGEEFGEKSLFGHGVSVYRPEVHVPLVVFPPGTRPGRVVTAPATLRELAATVADAVGFAEGSPFPGDSLSRFWSAPDAAPGPVMAEVEHQTKFAPSPAIPASLGPIASVVEGRHVYIRNADGREELYDLEGDPSESTNLIDTPGGEVVLPSMRRTMDRLQGRDQPTRTAGRGGADLR